MRFFKPKVGGQKVACKNKGCKCFGAVIAVNEAMLKADIINGTVGVVCPICRKSVRLVECHQDIHVPAGNIVPARSEEIVPSPVV